MQIFLCVWSFVNLEAERQTKLLDVILIESNWEKCVIRNKKLKIVMS